MDDVNDQPDAVFGAQTTFVSLERDNIARPFNGTNQVAALALFNNKGDCEAPQYHTSMRFNMWLRRPSSKTITRDVSTLLTLVRLYLKAGAYQWGTVSECATAFFSEDANGNKVIVVETDLDRQALGEEQVKFVGRVRAQVARGEREPPPIFCPKLPCHPSRHL